MARYIDADALIAEYDRVHEGAPGGARKLMVDAPAADVAEVKHGHWTKHEIIAKQAGYSVILYRHAECEKNPCRLFEAMNDYCPNCGAKMDGKKVE